MEAYLDPHVTSENRLPARARRFEGRSASLNGTWSFRLFDRPEDCGDFFSPEADERGWSPIRVPGNWQLQGFGKPVYTNVIYPWSLEKYGVDGRPDPWRVPAENPTGCYRRWFELPPAADGNVLLRFDGVETAFELYVNGTYVGYAEDSKLTSEFDVTPFVRPGRNLLALRVYTFATSSYLEDQDYWYLCGIHRDVDLIRVPAARIEDFRLEPVADRYGPGARFTADVRVSRTAGYSGRSIRGRILDPEGRVIAELTSPIAASAGYHPHAAPTAAAARLSLTLADVRRWSPETPVLYTAEFEYLDRDGKTLDSDRCRFGFKRVEIEDGILLLNGRRALIFGVNRHEFAWKEGRAVSRAQMIREIESMKRMNVNAVRTCHYPDSPAWYELCDEMGLLVLCECNLETHAVMGQISHDSDFAGVYVERAQRTVSQHRNHACVYGWSLGNESGFGPGHAAMYGLIKESDPTRICQYEAGMPGKNVSDIRGKMYATEKEILTMLTDPRDDRPVILVEFLYQIRNSGGRMEKFIDLTRRYERFQGGFVWDWQDKSLPLPLPDGGTGFAHGGDFGESFVETECPKYMTNNGLVRADLVWKPVAYEVREAYAPLLIDLAINDDGWQTLVCPKSFSVTNRTYTASSDDFSVTLTVSNGEGRTLRTLPVRFPALGPGEETLLDLRGACEGLEAEPALFYEFTVTRGDGAEVSRRQFRFRDGILPLPALPRGGLPEAAREEGRIVLRAGGSEAVFSEETGALLGYSARGERLVLGSALCHDRPYTGLDAEPGWGCRARMDEARALTLRFETPELLSGRDARVLSTRFSAGPALSGRLVWTLSGCGVLSCELTVQTARDLLLPRFGLELLLPAGMRRVSYLGLGPMENYSDRTLASRFGAYEADAEELGFAYSPPSENGGHEGTLSLAFRDEAGGALRFSAEEPFHFDAHFYSVGDCQAAAHTGELARRDALTVHLDAYHAPIGGDMAWSTALDAHDLPGAGTKRLAFRME